MPLNRLSLVGLYSPSIVIDALESGLERMDRL